MSRSGWETWLDQMDSGRRPRPTRPHLAPFTLTGLLINRVRPRRHRRATRDATIAGGLWKRSEHLTGVRFAIEPLVH